MRFISIICSPVHGWISGQSNPEASTPTRLLGVYGDIARCVTQFRLPIFLLHNQQATHSYTVSDEFSAPNTAFKMPHRSADPSSVLSGPIILKRNVFVFGATLFGSSNEAANNWSQSNPKRASNA